MTQMDKVYEWKGRKMVGSDNQKIGEISEIYLDEGNDRTGWATVTSGLFGTKTHFVPLDGASADGEQVRARVTKDQVRNAPSIDHHGQLSHREETRLFEYFGMRHSSSEGSVTAEPVPNGAVRAEQVRQEQIEEPGAPTA